MLSEKDRRALADIEQQLERESAALAAVLRGQEGAQRRARMRHDATILVAGVLAVFCIFLPDTAGAGFMSAILAIVVYLIRRWRFGESSGKAVEGAGGSKRPVRRWMGKRTT